MPTETELKLVLAPEALRRMRRNQVVRRLKRGRGVSDMLKSVYFDTNDLRLHNSDLVLRVRHVGDKRIQTLKNFAPTAGSLLGRQEWEAEIAGDQPEVPPLKAAAVDLPWSSERLVRNLHPVFTTEVRRTTYRLGADGWEVELALDEGQLIGPAGSTPIAEAELELKRGRPRILFDLARDLQLDTDARISVTSKSDRGYALLAGAGPAPRRARAPVFPPDATIAQAFQSIGRACAEQLLVNQDVLFATRDPEAVHQMRVALRRLVSGIRLFADFLETPETQALREEMRWLQSFLRTSYTSSQMHRLLAIILIVCPLASAQQKPIAPVPARLTFTAFALRKPDQTYALYLPSSYTPTKQWPIIYAFDPSARGDRPIDTFKAAAEKYGYIVAASNNSRNGPWPPEIEAAQAMSDDTHTLLAIDDQSRYFTGFSGGSRVAAQIALDCKCAAGVYLNGAGFPLHIAPSSKDSVFPVFAAVGNIDFNFPEVTHLDESLAAAGYSHFLRYFEGPHQWAPSEVAEEPWLRFGCSQ